MPERSLPSSPPSIGPHLLSLSGMTKEKITSILDAAETFLDVGHQTVKKVPVLRGKTLVNLFYESSTRTRSSFEIAAKRLSADVINVTPSQSSVDRKSVV